MTATDTYLLLRAFCEELARCGLRDAATSPGSRCTPLVLSLVRQPGIRCWSHLDERGAGFFALGAAKASGRPVAITCTSGTATANLTPAVIEARWARVPLVVLTADRPPELRDVGAGQTIDQLGLYGRAVKWFFEVGVHDATTERLRWIRTLACRAYATALAGPPGPVHLNFPLREPLVTGEALPDDLTGRPGGEPYVIVEPPTAAPPAHGPGPHPSGRLLVVAGSGTPDPVGLSEFAGRASIPLLADPLSGARGGPAAIAHYDLLLRWPEFTAARRPDFVFRVGDLPTSKPMRTWLSELADVPQIAFDPEHTWQDPASVVGMRLSSRLPQPETISVDAGWLESWAGPDAAVSAALDSALGERLSEPLVARVLSRQLGPETTLFVASSMPIRDLETFAPAHPAGPRVLANRGANGIDGTVASAFGAAAATGKPTVLLIGDVALAHDIGSLLTYRRYRLPLTIVLLNNDGGGIFEFLPVAEQVDAFEEHVATPHGLDFAKAADLYGCTYARPQSPSELGRMVARSLDEARTSILEVVTDRKENRDLHRRVAAATERALAAGR
ncbi:MAG TPA: 2-succinyl-5-enolpyruvyl-6-hydroxy-3-cyclohexene-1-carboxylic-acid synthase [Solirubrobacteraceae bacterium]|nr:2-succinyl-5-enolpyruvyl-6-hydroxy-3-cyclohexene-1-carboxylic-acid synthase [Solirubrobacteraceae bacterium]